MFISMYIYTHYMHAKIHVYVYVHICIHIHRQTCMAIYVCMYSHKYTFGTYACDYNDMFNVVCTHVCMCMYICYMDVNVMGTSVFPDYE